MSAAVGFVVTALAAWMDLRTGHISKWLTLAGVLAAAATSTLSGGWHGLGSALLGTAVALGVGRVLWRRVLGGGDIMVLAVVGAAVGWRALAVVGCIAVLLTVPYSACRAALRGQLVEWTKRFGWNIACELSGRRQLVVPLPAVSPTLRWGPFVFAAYAGWFIWWWPM